MLTTYVGEHCIIKSAYSTSQPKYCGCKKSSGQELIKGQYEKDMKSNWTTKASAVDEIKILIMMARPQ